MQTSYLFKQLIGLLIFFSLIFIGAGTFCYWQGLTYAAIGLVMFLLSYTLLRIDTDLLKERSAPKESSQPWDKTILGLSFLSTLSMYLIGGFDSGRYHWSPEFHPAVTLLGILLTITGQLLFLIAQKQNKFFSSTIRIQTERNHSVCDTGLYKFVRHPGYLGSIIQAVGFPLFFNSLWSIIPIVFTIALLVIRTSLEDNFLQQELGGYREYCQKTRFRLLPGIW